MTDIAKRLREFMRRSNISKSYLAKQLQLMQPTVNGYFLENSRSSRAMPLSFFEAVMRLYPEIDAEWIVRGKEPSVTPEDTPCDNIRLLQTEIERLRAQNTTLLQTNATLAQLLARLKDQD